MTNLLHRSTTKHDMGTEIGRRSADSAEAPLPFTSMFCFLLLFLFHLQYVDAAYSLCISATSPWSAYSASGFSIRLDT